MDDDRSEPAAPAPTAPEPSRAPSTEALGRLEAELAELEADLAQLEAADGGDA